MHSNRSTFWQGAFAGSALTIAAYSFSAGASLFGDERLAQTSKPAPKYASKIVLENDRVRVREVLFPPGVMDTGMHTHDLPHVGVILTAGSLTFTETGKATETPTFDAGSVGYRAANVTHQVANPGKTPMRVIEVELK